MKKILLGLLTFTSLTSFASENISCINAPLDALKSAVKTSDDKLITNYFSKMTEDEPFTKGLDFSVLLSVKRKSFFGSSYRYYQKDYDAFITMLIVQSAYVDERDIFSSLNIIANKVVSNQKNALKYFFSDYIDFFEKVTNRDLGTDLLGVKRPAYSNQSVMRVIRNLPEQELCTESGSLIKQKDLITLVKSKLTSSDQLVRQTR